MWWLVAGGGVASLAAGWLMQPERSGAAFLLGGVYLSGLGLGAMYILAMFTVAKARQHQSVRQVLTGLVACVPIAGLVLVPTMVALDDVYPWILQAQDEPRQHWQISHAFIARSTVYLGVWTLFGWLIWRRQKAISTAAGFLVIGTVTGWLAATDWLMSLQPEWPSTIFGMYALLGFIASAIAATLVGGVIGPRCRVRMPENQRVDIATMLFAANCLWMYLWYSQYMLIWYTNQGHEISYFLLRTSNGWAWAFVLTVVFHWVVPFGLLLSRAGKRHPLALSAAAISTLAGHWLDLYVMIMPAVDPAFLLPGWLDLGVALIIIAFCGRIVSQRQKARRTGSINSSGVPVQSG